jgi:hypothetical protein
MVEILWHSQTKGRETENTNLNLNRRASSRPYLMGLGSGNGLWLPDYKPPVLQNDDSRNNLSLSR